MKVKGMIIFLLFSFVFAAQKTNLKSVVVYTSGAYLTHEAEVTLFNGNNNIVLSRLAKGIVDRSIQISIDGKASILTVNKQFNYLQTAEESTVVKELEARLKMLVIKKRKLNNQKQVIAFERKAITENLDVGGDKGSSVANVDAMLRFVRSKMNKLNDDEIKIDVTLEGNDKEIKKVEQQLNDLKQKFGRPSEELALEIFSHKNQKVKISLSYMIYDAGWLPQYDIRVEKLDSPVNLNLKGGIWQRSGLNWKNIDVTISTNRPENQTKPELYPWFINFIQEQPKLMKSRTFKKEMIMETAAAPAPMEQIAADEAVEMNFGVSENLLSLEYQPSMKINIPSDGKKHFVELQKFEMAAEYDYYSAPKINRDVFLIAKTKDFRKYSLLPGEANVYFEKNYVGNTYFDPAITEDFYSFALGRDKNVIVERKQLKDFTEDKFLSGDIERFFGYELIVKNKTKNEINLTIEDNIPISNQESIEVELIEKGSALYDQKESKLKWEMKLKPGGDFKEEYKFSVRYPENRKIRNL